MQDASEQQQDDEAPAPDPRCEELDLDADLADYLALAHPCAECDQTGRPCWCAAAEG